MSSDVLNNFRSAKRILKKAEAQVNELTDFRYSDTFEALVDEINLEIKNLVEDNINSVD